MNYSEPLISQVTVFFRALGSGIILGILYDAVSIVRMLFGESKKSYVLFDTVFFISASLVSFFFMVLYNSGQVRLNLMLAELMGGMGFHFSFGKYITEKYALELHRVKKAVAFFIRPFSKIAVKIKHFLLGIYLYMPKKAKKGENKEKKAKKFCNIGKILLKNKNKSV